MRPQSQLGMPLLTLFSNHLARQNGGIFGVALNVSIKYANVAISLTNDKGESFIYGYVPIVVAKCGVFLKDQGISYSTQEISFFVEFLKAHDFHSDRSRRYLPFERFCTAHQRIAGNI